jgi:hypothetical protein
MIRNGVTALALLVFAASTVWSVRTGLADYWGRQGSIAGAERAAAIAPDNAVWQILLAILVADSDPGWANRALLRAAELNPCDAQVWINLGLRAEVEGNLSDSERFLLRAAEVDKTYLPRWTLANYYARRGQTDIFWQWAVLAAQRIHGDPVPLFRLCGGMVEDGNLIERLGLKDPSLQASFLRYLLDNGHMEVIQNAVERVFSNGRTNDTRLLLDVCERFTGQGKGREALAIWNRLAEAKSIAAQPLDPVAGATLTNGNFAVTPLARGFDWRLLPIEGISVSRLEQPPGVRVLFTGNHPELSDPLLQWLPAEPGVEYAFTWRHTTRDIPRGSGPRWVVSDGTGGILGQSGNLWSEVGATDRVAFVAPAGCRLVRLALIYQRTPRTSRFTGSLALSELRVVAVGRRR